MKKRMILLNLLFLCLIAGCGYHVGSVPPAGVTAIFIPVLENATNRQEITSDVTDGIIRRFKTDGTVKITGKDEADAILYGKIVGYRSEAVLYDRQDVANEFRVVITVDINLVNAKDGKTIYSARSVEGQAVARLTVNQFETERTALPQVIDDLSKKAVEAIMERAW
jgi:hypothetical protein